jgi:hypothetical protein
MEVSPTLANSCRSVVHHVFMCPMAIGCEFSSLHYAKPCVWSFARSKDWKPRRSRRHQLSGHLERLKQVAEKLGKRLAGHTCAAMKGLIEEGSEWIGEDAAAEVMDAGIIAVTSQWLSGLIPTALTAPTWPPKTIGLAEGYLAVRSQIRAVRSELPVTSQWLSGLIDTVLDHAFMAA